MYFMSLAVKNIIKLLFNPVFAVIMAILQNTSVPLLA